jgi:hypothetical protein
MRFCARADMLLPLLDERGPVSKKARRAANRLVFDRPRRRPPYNAALRRMERAVRDTLLECGLGAPVVDSWARDVICFCMIARDVRDIPSNYSIGKRWRSHGRTAP